VYVYTQEEIEAFVKNHLLFGGLATTRVDSSRRLLAGIIAMLPPWQQSIIVERKIVHVVGDYEFINEHGNRNRAEKRSISGFFAGGNSIYGRKSISDGVFYAIGAAPPSVTSRTIRHEQGHLLDLLTGGFKDNTRAFRSDLSPHWQAAMQGDIHRYDAVAKLSEHTAAQEISADTDENSIHSEIYYDDYRMLINHLKFYDDPKEHPREAFAEISTHYASLYAKTAGNEEKIDQILGKAYPQMWKIFKTEVFDRGHMVAAALQLERALRTQAYMDKVKRIFEDAKQPYNPGIFEKRVKVADAAGQYDEAMGELSYIGPFLGRPVQLYAIFKEQLDDQHKILKEMSGEKPKPDQDAVKKITEVIEHKGLDVAVLKYLAIVREHRAAREFVPAFYHLSFAMGGKFTVAEAGQVFQEIFGGISAFDRFKSLYAEGGPARVHDMVKGIPEKSDVQLYVKMQEEFCKARAAIDPTFSLEAYLAGGLRKDLIKEISKAVKSPFESVQDKALEIDKMHLCFHSYVKFFNNTIKKISDVTGANDFEHKTKGAYAYFIRGYRADNHKQNYIKIDNLDVLESVIEKYVDAHRQVTASLDFRDKISDSLTWCIKDGRYRVVTHANDFSQVSHAETAETIMNVLMAEGAEGLEKRTADYLKVVHEAVKYNLSQIAMTPQWQGKEDYRQVFESLKGGNRGTIIRQAATFPSQKQEYALQIA